MTDTADLDEGPVTASIAADLLSTEDLMDRLLAAASLEDYLDRYPTDTRSLADYLACLLEENGITKSQAIRRSGLGVTFAYQVFEGRRKVGRDNAIRLAFGLGASLRQTQRLLRLAGLSELYCKVPRDAVVIYCVSHGASLQETEETLLRLGQAPLAPDGGR